MFSCVCQRIVSLRFWNLCMCVDYNLRRFDREDSRESPHRAMSRDKVMKPTPSWCFVCAGLLYHCGNKSLAGSQVRHTRQPSTVQQCWCITVSGVGTFAVPGETQERRLRFGIE